MGQRRRDIIYNLTKEQKTAEVNKWVSSLARKSPPGGMLQLAPKQKYALVQWQWTSYQTEIYKRNQNYKSYKTNKGHIGSWHGRGAKMWMGFNVFWDSSPTLYQCRKKQIHSNKCTCFHSKAKIVDYYQMIIF